jgi:hypothetical protein
VPATILTHDSGLSRRRRCPHLRGPNLGTPTITAMSLDAEHVRREPVVLRFTSDDAVALAADLGRTVGVSAKSTYAIYIRWRMPEPVWAAMLCPTARHRAWCSD